MKGNKNLLQIGLDKRGHYKLMKILLITLRADHGGGPKHVNLLINNLSEDFELYVGCPNDKPYYQQWKENEKVKDIFILSHRKFSFKKLFFLYRFINKNQISIVHSHGKGAGIYSRFLKILNPKLKVIHTLHGFHIQEYGILKKNIYIYIEKFLTLFTDKFINVSNGEKTVCLSYKIFENEQSKVIYNGIKPINLIKNAKKKINLENKIIITTISRFDYPKNMFLTYEIAKKFKNNKNILFLWLGDGNDKLILEQKAKKENVNIIFTGFTKDIPLYLSATDIYLSTSRWEGLPYALIEAQSLGLPIVATNVVGNNEVVINNKNGFLFESVNEACDCISKLIINNFLYNSFSKNAKQNFMDKFAIRIMINKTNNIYKEYLK
jgi:glycosyltransferase involved in cell wall biosynthesis